MKKLIQSELFKYGFLPLLIVIERMVEIENYEISQLIINVIQEYNIKFGLSLPTKLSAEAMVEIKLSFMTNFGLMGDIAYENSESYANEIEKSINLFKNK